MHCAQAVRTACAGCRVVAPIVPYRRPSGRPCRGLGGRIVALAGRVASCIATQPSDLASAPLSRYTQLYRDTPVTRFPLVTIQFCIVPQVPQRPDHALLSRYNDCIVTHSPAQLPPVTIQFIVSRLGPPACLVSALVTIHHTQAAPIATQLPPQPRYKVCIVTQLSP